MKICLTFILLLHAMFSSYAQEKSDSLSYPDLIPILENGQYGYCDKDKNIIIKPQFEWVSFFGEDPDFYDIKDPKKKVLGKSNYATVWREGKRMRIDKKGNVIYQYNLEDFNEITPKESVNPTSFKQPFEKFQDDKTHLWGVRDMMTGEVLIPAQYPIIEEELYSHFHVPQYPLILVSSPSGDTKFYIGLNATEYRIDINQNNKNMSSSSNIKLDDNNYGLPYPDLIPVLQHGVKGYCDQDMNVIIEPQFYRADFFETDLSFQIGNVNNLDIARFGNADYAWVETGDNKRFRIDKKGNLAYHYNEADFKSDAAYISLDEQEGFRITGLDNTTLLQIVNHSKTIDDSSFFEITKINVLENPEAGMLINCHLHQAGLPFVFFRDEQTKLEGVKDMNTGKTLIEPKWYRFEASLLF